MFISYMYMTLLWREGERTFFPFTMSQNHTTTSRTDREGRGKEGGREGGREGKVMKGGVGGFRK